MTARGSIRAAALGLGLAAVLASAGCKRREPAPADEANMTAPEDEAGNSAALAPPVEVPAERPLAPPAPLPEPLDNTTAVLEPDPGQEEQMRLDADATGLTSRVERAPDEDTPDESGTTTAAAGDTGEGGNSQASQAQP